MNDMTGVKLHLVESFDEAAAFMRWLGERRNVLAVDTETGGLEFWRKDLRLVQFGDAQSGWAIPFEMWRGLITEALSKYTGAMVLHNAKFDVQFLEHHAKVKMPWWNLHDTRIMAHILDPVHSTALKNLAERFVDRKSTVGQQRLDEAMSSKKWTWETVPVTFEPYWSYGALDAVLTARLYDTLAPRIAHGGFSRLYDVEMSVAQIITTMERLGARIDIEYTQQTHGELVQYIDAATLWVAETYGVQPARNQQVADRLLADGVRLEKTTATGKWAMDEEVLSALDHPLAQTTLKIRKSQKVLSTYFKNFLEMHDNGFVHPSINQLGARTGRMSVGTPALQTLPRGPLVRDCFIPRSGNVLILADYDQIELRLLAHFAREKRMIEAIHAGVDLHTYTAQLAYGDDTIDKKDSRRQLAKNAGFAKIYGAGIAKFADTAGVPFTVAEEFLARYDVAYPGVRRFQREVEATAQARKSNEGVAYVTTPLGRRQPADDQHTYKLVNYLIQGTAADVLKTAMSKLANNGLLEYMILPVHDELIFDVPADIADDVSNEVARIMPDMDTFTVPLSAGVDVVSRWGDKYR